MAFIAGFGAAVPERVVGNEELAGRIGRTADWIRNVSGIEQRRYVDSETVIDLAVSAAESCLDKAGCKPSELGMIVMSCSTSPRRFPGPASQVANRLGLTETPALDLPVASAGALVAMSLAADVAASRGPVLVVAAEIMSRIVLTEPLDPSVCILFGDGAGACLIHPSRGGARVLGSVMGTDGTFSEDLRLEDSTFLMNGRSVILQASRKMPRAVSEILRRFSLAASDVGTYLMHQANQNLMDRVADAIGVERDRFFSNIARYGNTSSASMLIAASEWAENEGFRVGGRVCFTAFGAGFHWGALLAEGVASPA